MKNIILTFCIVSFLPNLIRADAFELAPNYALLFDGKSVYQGAGIDLRLTNEGIFDWGVRFQLFVADKGWSEGPRFFDLDIIPRLKHVFSLGDTQLEIYCLIPVGVTVGGQKYVTKDSKVYEAAGQDNVVPFSGINLGAIPGVNFRFTEHWSIFTELGFRYHWARPSELKIQNNNSLKFAGASEIIRPDYIHLLSGVFNAGLAYRF
ncbi:MAG: hypothetical protein WCK42_00240 [Myxococcaceae bacterium]